MSYDLYVTRANEWSANDGAWIGPEEWLAVVREDAELYLIADSEPYPTEWLHNPSGRSTSFEWKEGNIFVTNPSKPVIMKLEALADRLWAKVQGDDGELYRGGEVATE